MPGSTPRLRNRCNGIVGGGADLAIASLSKGPLLLEQVDHECDHRLDGRSGLARWAARDEGIRAVAIRGLIRRRLFQPSASAHVRVRPSESWLLLMLWSGRSARRASGRGGRGAWRVRGVARRALVWLDAGRDALDALGDERVLSWAA